MGLGNPIFTLSRHELQAFLKASSIFLIVPLLPLTLSLSQANYISICTYPLSSTFIKTAVLLQYLRVFTEPRTRLLCKCLIAIAALMGVVFAICSWFACFPVTAFWDLSIQNPRCWGFASRNKLEFMSIMVTQVVTAAVMDLVIFLIPARLYFRPGASKSTATRLSLLGLFVLGFSYVQPTPNPPSPLRKIR
jgi:hypothetical protein